MRGPDDLRQLGAHARLITVPTIVLRDQAPERAVELGESLIGSVEDSLEMIEEPFAQIFERAGTAQIRADQLRELVCERRHDASP